MRAMKRWFALALLLPFTACGLVESSDGDEPAVKTGGVGGSVPASTGGASPGSGGLTSGGIASSGGIGSGGVETGGAHAAGGSNATGGGDEDGGAGGELSCGCSRGGRGASVSCEDFGSSLGEDAVLWTCDSPPYPGLEEAGCEGFGSGIFRMCCPASVTGNDFCSR